MNTTQRDLFPETLLVARDGDRVFTTSLQVAEHFGKRHKNVLRAIENLLADLPAEDVTGLNFEPAGGLNGLTFEPVDYLDAKGEARLMYRLSHDAFALLAMGFTGRAALVWKVKFLAAFRALAREVSALRDREAQALFRLRPRWQPIVQHPAMRRSELIGLTGHRSPGSITACRRRMRQVGLLGN